jgi:hypothetical protein
MSHIKPVNVRAGGETDRSARFETPMDIHPWGMTLGPRNVARALVWAAVGLVVAVLAALVLA